MTWPEPRPGLVIRYAYLWDREARAGQEEGAKDRPCAVVLAVRDEDGDTRVYVLPITHAAPHDPAEAVELPAAVKRHLGLDEARSWVVLTEANVFVWPGPDLRPVPGQGPESVAYGHLPPRLLRTIRDRFVARYRERQGGLVTRSE
ncbi:hypothetical protein M0638_27775 [Roseomonas sp. NAR14]|uniref:Growth inhibitor PemK n=1 Tax=Roseomonas acroporae TaxID=2937791 RepID=A0A9X1YFX8_9PROT|nr:hypothetical protein [Roseomonas acroporae]MCK8788153.1 hypothetical protein [Roseomonas acroporae]